MIQEKDLDAKELGLVQSITNVFKERYNGRMNAVKSDDIIFHLKATGIISFQGRDLRKIIGYIRKYDLVKPHYIVSNVHAGYWLTKDEAELKAFLDQELNRMSNQYHNVKALHQRIKSNVNIDQTVKQMNLFG